MTIRLAELIAKAKQNYKQEMLFDSFYGIDMPSECEYISNYLISYGVIIPDHKPSPLIKSEDENNSDVYCPFCGINLSGYYCNDSDPPKIVTCFGCGSWIDTTKCASREDNLPIVETIHIGDKVRIVGSADEENYKDCIFEVLSAPYDVCGSMVVKMKCHQTGKYFGGGYDVKFLRKETE